MSGVEIERKYLVRELPGDVAWESEQRLRQGYVALDGSTEVRVRLREDASTLTVKRGAGRVRAEVDVPLDDDRARALWELTEGRRLEKVRRTVRLGADVVEVDEYAGALAGLRVAEVEFTDPAAAEAFEPPSWFGREVTGEAAYANRALACDGLPRGEG